MGCNGYQRASGKRRICGAEGEDGLVFMGVRCIRGRWDLGLKKVGADMVKWDGLGTRGIVGEGPWVENSSEVWVLSGAGEGFVEYVRVGRDHGTGV